MVDVYFACVIVVERKFTLAGHDSNRVLLTLNNYLLVPLRIQCVHCMVSTTATGFANDTIYKTVEPDDVTANHQKRTKDTPPEPVGHLWLMVIAVVRKTQGERL